jgi:hypothetical protein
MYMYMFEIKEYVAFMCVHAYVYMYVCEINKKYLDSLCDLRNENKIIIQT